MYFLPCILNVIIIIVYNNLKNVLYIILLFPGSIYQVRIFWNSYQKDLIWFKLGTSGLIRDGSLTIIIWITKTGNPNRKSIWVCAARNWMFKTASEKKIMTFEYTGFVLNLYECDLKNLLFIHQRLSFYNLLIKENYFFTLYINRVNFLFL